MKELLLIIVGSALVNNVVLSQFLGLCPFLGVSKSVNTAAGMGGAVIFVITLSSFVTSVIYKLILVPLNLTYLQTIVFILIIAGIAVFLNFVPLALWISAIAAGVNVGIFNLVGMRFRRVPASQIVLPLIKANKAGLDVNVNQLEAHYLAGGNVDRVIDALIAAHRAQIPLSFERSCAIDLAGRNVLEAVQMSVNPEVIETPVVSAVAKDGIELKVKARVTVRANIDRLVGGAGEATIIARVGEGIVTNVGSAVKLGHFWIR